MTKRELTENLRLLHGLKVGGEPSRAWAQETRRMLVNQVRQSAQPHWSLWSRMIDVLRIYGFTATARVMFRPAMAVILMLAVVLGGFSVGVSVSYASVPGDPLYFVKRATERAQLALTPSADDQARLQMEFVGRRVEEVTRLADSPEASRSGRLAEAVANLREDVSAVQNQLASLKVSSPSAAIEVAKMVDRKTEEYHSTLKKTDAAAPEPAPAMQEAKNIVADASVKAISIIVDGVNSGATPLSEQEVAAKLDDKIKAVSDRVSDLELAMSTSTPSYAVKASANQAKVALSQAKVLVEHNDLSGALVKMIEGKELVKAAEQIANATNAAASAASSTNGLVAPPATPSAVLSVPALIPPITTSDGNGANKTVSSTPAIIGSSTSLLEGSTLQPASSTIQLIIIR